MSVAPNSTYTQPGSLVKVDVNPGSPSEIQDWSMVYTGYPYVGTEIKTYLLHQASCSGAYSVCTQAVCRVVSKLQHRERV